MCRSPRQTPFGRGVDLALILAQLGRNPRQVELPVDLFLGCAGHLGLAFELEQAVFVGRVAHLQAARAERDVVLLAAGEVEQRRTVGFGRQRPHVHLDRLQTDFGAGFVDAPGEHFADARMRDETVERGFGAGTGDEQVQIADGLFSAAQASGRGDLFDAGRRGQVRHQFCREFAGEAQQKAAAALAVLRDRA